jgi:hypothetical protein
MGDIPNASGVMPIPEENVYGIGVAGPPAERPEEPAAEEVIQKENAENGDEAVGRNIDIEA